jgi:O-acetylserine/cysteine efflux transporter
MPNHQTISPKDYFAIFLIVLIWGTNFVAMKFALEELTPFQLGAWRFVFSLIPFIFIFKPPKIAWQWLLLNGLLQGVGQFGFLFVALHIGLSAALASMLLQTQVFFTALFSYFILTEKPSKSFLVGLGFAAIGLTCFGLNYVFPNSVKDLQVPLLGIVLCLCGAMMWGASNITIRKVHQKYHRFDAINFIVWSSFVPIIPFIFLNWIFFPEKNVSSWFAHNASTWLSIIYLAIFSYLVAYALWTRLIQTYSANRISPFSLGVPMVGLLSGMIILSETISPWQWAGIVFCFIALVITMVGRDAMAFLKK